MAFINILIILFIPFLFTGAINRFKSAWAGRKGAPLIQPFRDFMRLMKKGEVISTVSSVVFRIAPSAALASTVTAALIVPLAGGKSLLSFDGDFVLFAYCLSLGRFFTIAGALDTGSGFEGMGASREALFSTLAEPALFGLAGSLSLISGGMSFEDILSFSAGTGSLSYLIPILGAMLLFVMLLAEGCRVPVDDPNTHLELTMIHEVMVLDNSGPDMGFIMYASALKMAVFASLAANIILPREMPVLLSLASFAAIYLILAAAVATVETVMARLRMTHVPRFLFFMTSLFLIILSAVLLFKTGGLS